MATETSHKTSIMSRNEHTKFATESLQCNPVKSGKKLLMQYNSVDDDDKENTQATSRSRRKRQERQGSTVSNPPNHEKPEWQKRLSEQLQEKEQRLAKRRKLVPTMTQEELQCINTVWSILEKQDHSLSNNTTPPEDRLHRLSEELGVSQSHTQAILNGDPGHVVPEPYKREVLQKLAQWVQHQSLTLHSRTPRTPLIKLKVFQSKKSARSALHHDKADHTSDDSLASPTATTSTHCRSTKPKSCSPRRSLSSPFHHLNDTRMNTAQKRRSSIGSMHSSMTSLSSYSSSTSFSKRPARPSYEPPSVKRRKLRLSGRLSMERSHDHLLSFSQRLAHEKSASFCPIAAARKHIMTEMTKLQRGNHEHRALKTMEMEHLELSLHVWDKIQENPESKVEVVVASMATTLDISHRRLTRFLRGDHSNLLTKQEIIKISTKLRDWLKHP